MASNPTVDGVSHDRVTDAVEVDPNLMLPSSGDRNRREGQTAQPFRSGHSRDSGPRASCAGGHLLAVCRVSTKGGFNASPSCTETWRSGLRLSHLTVIPKITEFLGYEEAPFQNQVIAGVGNTVSGALQQPLALPSIRVRYITSTVHVWDGQTLVLGGLIAENVVKVKDKVPMLGDLPFVGRLFRSERSHTEKKNLMIFVSPRIIDPAGNPVHTEDDWPYNSGNIPAQQPALDQARY